MTRIGIIVAMSKELALITPLLEDHTTLSLNGFTFHSGILADRPVVVMECGIGKVNAAAGALTLIENFHPALVINTGVAGGTGGAAGVLDLVLASGVAYHDVWCGPGTEPGQAAGCPRIFPSPLPTEMAEKIGAKSGLVASGDIFISSPEEVSHIKALYPEAIACDMESAAIAQICHLKSVPFVCIRVISDTPGAADNIAQYENFWADAPARTFSALTTLLREL
ncbi:MAG: 5'-methylthioadenosine/adenosylhomocysteine nucleosidase [Muribaculaceae bacterium]|nr:5'-methylthioadenosine/adenosylhomocysteine nucleosidase [Muribaculaceae bacterium]